MASPWTIDANQANFNEQVLERSRSTPVLVDFWAPWCGPCLQLGPLLEKVVNDQQGAIILAKINTDENPEVARLFGIQGIPAVKVFVNAVVAGEFMGALPEYEVRRFVQQWVKTEADALAEQGALHETRQEWEQALAAYLQALQKNAKHPKAWAGRLRALISLKRLGEAQSACEGLPAELMASGEIKSLQTKLELSRIRQTGPTIDALKEGVKQDPEDLEARYQLASGYAAQKQYREAMEELLTILRKDRQFKEGIAREMMVKLFELVGVRSPLAEEYREKLAQVFF